MPSVLSYPQCFNSAKQCWVPNKCLLNEWLHKLTNECNLQTLQSHLLSAPASLPAFLTTWMSDSHTYGTEEPSAVSDQDGGWAVLSPSSSGLFSSCRMPGPDLFGPVGQYGRINRIERGKSSQGLSPSPLPTPPPP